MNIKDDRKSMDLVTQSEKGRDNSTGNNKIN